MRKSALLVAPLLLAGFLVPALPAAAIDDIDTTRIREAVTVAGILKHERAFQQIANQNGGTRASGTPGYDASAQYVKRELRKAGYRVSEQSFEFPFYEELAPASLTQLAPVEREFATSTFTYSGSGEVTGELVPALNIQIPPGTTPSSSSAGCVVGDYASASATETQVALVQRGTCTFGEKAAAAQAAGYDAVIIFNEGQPGRTVLLEGTLGAPDDIPVVGLSFDDGAALYAATAGPEPVIVEVITSTDSRIALTTNVLADTVRGNADRTIVVGGHLDSVVEGPGINDNGSGTAAILETAIQMSKLKIRPVNKIRFAFWGAEELGLLGSEYYVANLNQNQLSRIYANLNFDMVGSPNYVRFVYDGDGSLTPGVPPLGPPGSAQIESLFTEYFASQGLASEPTEFSGRSDYGPFIAVGIPAGGLFSGAEGIKTPAQAAIYGGTAGQPYDACYHLACDTITNLSTKALFEFGDAIAHSVATMALTESGFFEDGSRVGAQSLEAAAATEFEYKGSHLVR